MTINILMPALSPTMTEGNLVRWHVQEAQLVKPGDLLAEIETDKATMEVEAVDGGTIGKIMVPAGSENVQVNTIIAVLLEAGETSDKLNAFIINDSKKDQDASLTSSSQSDSSKTGFIQPPIPIVQQMLTPSISNENASLKALHLASSTIIDLNQPKSNSISTNRLFVSPLAERVAEQMNIDLNQIQGTGPNGRIVKADVLEAQSSLNTITKNIVSQPTQSLTYDYSAIKLNNMRKVIAKRLCESKQSVPHFYVQGECHLDKLLKLRQEINHNLTVDEKLSVNDFVIKAMGLAMRSVPEANAQWDNDQIKIYNQVDISVAVAIEGGLITPILTDVVHKPLAKISAEMKQLAQRARDNKLKPHEFQGGTISLSNLGMHGVKNFAAIINPPQACILAVGQATQAPIVKDDQLCIGTLMQYTLSVDHRVIDGAVGARYLQAFKNYLENPLKLLLA